MHEEIRRITMNPTRRAALAVVIVALTGGALAGVATAMPATQPGSPPDCPGCSAAVSQATERTASDRDR